MELWTGALYWWKCHWPDLKSAGLFPRNLFLNSLKTSTLYWLPYSCHTSHHPSQTPCLPWICIFEIHQLWKSGFSRVYSNCCCSCSFEPEIIKIGQSSPKMYSNNILNFQESTTILNACTKQVWKLIEYTTCVYICVCVCIYIYIYIYNLFLCEHV